MACYSPIPARQNGSEPPRLWPEMGTANLQLPCGKCIGCRTDKATQWANRCSHEAQQWPANTFLTLTYDDDHLPEAGHLKAKDLQLFIKRLRQHAHRNRSSINGDRRAGIRFLACGEYGEHTNRPHYHALLFNCGFTDQKKVGKDLYESETIARLWPHGQNRVGEATAASAAYIAQYNLKKQGQGDHDADGVWRPAPFLRMSLRPAVGNGWITKYATDLTHGYLVENNRKHPIPRYYQNQLKKHKPELWDEIQARAQSHRVDTPTDNNDPARKRDAEKIHIRRKQLLEQRTKI